MKNKNKKWSKRIMIVLLIALSMSIAAPTLVGRLGDGTKTTVYAATCKTSGETAAQCTPETTGKCPTNYTYDATNKVCKKSTTTSKVDDNAINTMKALISVSKIVNRAIWPVLVMIGGLMDNSLLFGNGMEERLREIWIPIRNIVNILFVIALIAIAIYNILGIGDENGNYSIKAILPKIIIGIIVVNFSFLGIKVMLDGVNVLTSAIFAIPNQVGGDMVLDPQNDNDKAIIDKYCRSMSGKEYKEKLDYVTVQKETDDQLYVRLATSNKYSKYFEGKLGGSNATKDGVIAAMNSSKMTPAEKTQFNQDIKDNQNGSICTLKKGKDKMELTSRGELFLKRWNARNSALAMALGLSKIVLYKEVNLNSLDKMDKLVVNTALSLILYLLFVASFLALFVVLLGRLVVLWLAIALSPVLLLAMTIPAVKENVSGFGEITDTFVQNAIAPLGIGLSLSIGWIMLKALQGINGLYGGEQISFTATEGIPVVGLTTIQDLLVGVGTIAVIWLGVFTAASKSIAAPITDKMKGFLQQAGEYVGTLPLKHAPIFRIDLPDSVDGGDDKYTGLQVWDAMQSVMQGKDINKLTSRLGRTRVNPNDIADKNKVKSTEDVLGWLRNARNQRMSAKDVQSAMKTLMVTRRKDIWDKMRTNPKYRDISTRIREMVNANSKNREDKKQALFKAPDLGYSSTTAKASATPKKHSASQPIIKQDVQQRNNIINNRNTLTQKLDSPSATKSEVENTLKTFLQTLPGGTTTQDLNGTYLRKDTYDALKQKVGEDFIKKNLPKKT